MRQPLKRALLLAAVLLALGASSASADTIIVSSNPIYQRWVDEAKMPTPDVTLTVVETGCPDGVSLACTAPGTDTIWEEEEYRPTFLHELGHNFDYLLMPVWARERFETLTADPGPWTNGRTGADERFADTYSRCARTGPRPRGVFTNLRRADGRELSVAAYAAICRMIVAVG